MSALNLVAATLLLCAAAATALGPHAEPLPRDEDEPAAALTEVALPEPLAWLVDLEGCSAYRLTFLRTGYYVVWEVGSHDATYGLHDYLGGELVYCGFLGRRN